MGGQTNSWFDTMRIREVPCIGDTVRQVSSANEYSTGLLPFEDSLTDGSTDEQCTFPWLWVLGAVAIGYLIKGNRRQRV